MLLADIGEPISLRTAQADRVYEEGLHTDRNTVKWTVTNSLLTKPKSVM